MRRRDFLTASGSICAAWLLAACGSLGPKGAHRGLNYAMRKNETLGRGLFRHTTMDSPSSRWRNAGVALPKYYISDTVPVWDVAARGAWTLEVSGLVTRPLTLTMDMLQRMQSNANIQVQIVPDDFPSIREVDLKLLELAKKWEAKVVTNDFNLNKVAHLHHVEEIGRASCRERV